MYCPPSVLPSARSSAAMKTVYAVDAASPESEPVPSEPALPSDPFVAQQSPGEESVLLMGHAPAELEVAPEERALRTPGEEAMPRAASKPTEATSAADPDPAAAVAVAAAARR